MRERTAAALRRWARVAWLPLAVLAVAAAYPIPAHTLPDTTPPPAASQVSTAGGELPSSAVGARVRRHNCWTGEAPADVAVPGHVVVTLPTGTVTYGAERLVGRALAQLFAGTAHGLTVHAFCR